MAWAAILIAAIAAVYAYSRIPKPQLAPPPSLDDLEAPTAEEGRSIPVLFGRRRIKSPNVVWYGDLNTTPVRQKVKGLLGSKYQNTGQYKVYLGMHMIIGVGPFDSIDKIEVGDKIAWEGFTTGGQIVINNNNLFGGDKKQGGVVGSVDIEMGLQDQLQNDYLLSVLGEDIPAYRGVVGVVLRHVYLGTTNYIKPWTFWGSRIHSKSDGSLQWYDEKAEVYGGDINTSIFYEQFAAGLAGYSVVILPGQSEGGSLDDFSIVNDSFGPALQIGTGDSNSHPSIAKALLRDAPASVIRAKFKLTATGSDDCGSFAVRDADLNAVFSFSVSRDSTVDALRRPTVSSVDQSGNPGNPLGAGQVTTGVWYQFEAVFNPVTAVMACTITNIGSGVVFGAVEFEVESRTNIAYVTFENDNFLGAGASRFDDVEIIQPEGDMNPAHIIREALTDRKFALRYSDSQINDTVFEASADTLFSEGMGISLYWTGENSIEEFIGEVLRHIDGNCYVDKKTGWWVLRLVRDDYDIESLPVLNESNVVSVKNYKQPTISELTNSVTVVFWDAATGNDASVTVQDPVLVDLQGGIVNETIQYPGFTNHDVASRAALRDLRARSAPMISCTVTCDRTAAELNIGDPFVLIWPDLKINGLVMRVDSISLGDMEKAEIIIDCVQDVFASVSGAGLSPVAPPDSGLWVDPTIGTPQAASPRLVMESPYYYVVESVGQSDADAALALDAGFGIGMVAAGRQGNELNANIVFDYGDGYEDAGYLDFAAWAEIENISRDQTKVYVDGGSKDLPRIAVPVLGSIGDEIVIVEEVGEDSSGNYFTIGRGALDTIPQVHESDSSGTLYLLVWGEYAESDERQYTEGELLFVKILSEQGDAALAQDDAPADSFIFDSRAIRPLPPANVKINNEYWPTIVAGDAEITFRQRNRLEQTGTIPYDWFEDADLIDEAGQTYAYELYDADDNSLIATGSGYTDSPISISQSAMVENNRLELFSVRNGYESWQRYIHAFVAEMDSGTGGGDPVGDGDAFYSADPILTTGWEVVSGPSAIYDSGTDRTYMVWQFTDRSGSPRKGIRIAYYDHATSAWSDRRTIGNFYLQDDDHGHPAIVKDADGYLFVFFGSHNNLQKWSVSNSPDDISGWTQNADLSNNVTYPYCVRIGSTIYLFNRDDTTSSRRTCIVRSGSVSGGVLSLGTALTLVDLGADSRIYRTECHAIGTEIHFAATLANEADTERRGIYYFVYDTAGGDVSNWDGSFVVPASSLPVDITEANGNFRIYDHGSNSGDVPSLQFDNLGEPHVIFADGSGSSYDIKHMYIDSGVWTGPVTIDSISDLSPVFGYVGSYCLVPASAELWAFYNKSGDVYRSVWNGITWSSAELIREQSTYADFGRIAYCLNGDPSLRCVISEISNWTTDADAVDCSLYGYGDSGLLSGTIDGSGGDASFSDVVLLIGVESRNNAITLIDESPACFRVAGFFGNAKVDASQFKFGSASIRLDGTGDYVTYPTSSAFSASSGDFTVESWIRLDQINKLQQIIGKRASGGTPGEWQFVVSVGNVLQVIFYNGASAVLNISGSATLTTGTWYHVAFSRSGTTVRVFLNGALEASGTQSASPSTNSTDLFIGRDPSNTGRDFNGWQDEIRITRAARYTAAFTAPSAAFPRK